MRTKNIGSFSGEKSIRAPGFLAGNLDFKIMAGIRLVPKIVKVNTLIAQGNLILTISF